MGPEQPRRDAARWNTVELQSRFAVNPEIGPRCGASPPDPSFVAANARILIANGMLRRWTGCDECSEVILMVQDKRRDWREICEEVLQEADQARLNVLLQELLEVLEDRERWRSRGVSTSLPE